MYIVHFSESVGVNRTGPKDKNGQWKDKMGDDISLQPGCASCGERYYDIDLKLTSLDCLEILQLTEGKRKQYTTLQERNLEKAMNVFALPVPPLPPSFSEMQQEADEEDEQSNVHKVPILHHLHPQFAKRVASSNSTDNASPIPNVQEQHNIPQGAKASDWEFLICLPCRKSILEKKQLPRFSLANGHDYGNPRAVIPDFDKLTYLEKSACMVNRLYQNVYKATPETGGEGHFTLSGHMIVFEHTGMKEASKFVTQLPRSDMKEQVKVIYLGT
jgi:hypothetical protein